LVAEAKEAYMSRLIGFVINDAQRVACALHPARATLVAAHATEGWGLASYQGGEVLLQRHPKPVAGALDFYPHVAALRTDYVVGQVREPGTPAKPENTQPYRFRSWVFARSGAATEPGAGAGLAQLIPDFLRRNIRGQDPAEALFYLFLADLHEDNRLDDPNIKLEDAGAALAGALARAAGVEHTAGGSPTAANVMLTNGRVLLAARHGKPMFVSQVNGVTDCRVCAEPGDDSRRDRRRINHEHVKAVLMVSEPGATPEPGFEEVPDGAIIGISRDVTRTILTL
jgi:glutamine amidotransferase